MPKCKRHPKIETNLACGKCGDLICPRCLVETPVGARCSGCARLSRVPTYRVSKLYYLRASGAGLGAAILGGLAWEFISPLLGFFSLLLAAAIGLGIGELISLSTNRKSGIGLAAVGGIAALLSFGLSYWFLNYTHFSFLSLVAAAVAIFVSIARLR
jgi:hypothetical protein